MNNDQNQSKFSLTLTRKEAFFLLKFFAVLAPLMLAEILLLPIARSGALSRDNVFLVLGVMLGAQLVVMVVAGFKMFKL